MIPLHDDCVRIVSIDPGSNRAGFSVLDFDLVTGVTTVQLSHTVKGEVLLRERPRLAEIYGEREARNMCYGDYLHDLLQVYEPFAVASEAPYQGKFVATYRALTEQLTCFRAAVYRYCRSTSFVLVEPSPVKVFMGVKGTSGDKDLMRDALLRRTDVVFAEGVVATELDEHSIDSICVGLCKLHDRIYDCWMR